MALIDRICKCLDSTDVDIPFEFYTRLPHVPDANEVQNAGEKILRDWLCDMFPSSPRRQKELLDAFQDPRVLQKMSESTSGKEDTGINLSHLLGSDVLHRPRRWLDKNLHSVIEEVYRKRPDEPASEQIPSVPASAIEDQVDAPQVEEEKNAKKPRVSLGYEPIRMFRSPIYETRQTDEEFASFCKGGVMPKSCNNPEDPDYAHLFRKSTLAPHVREQLMKSRNERDRDQQPNSAEQALFGGSSSSLKATDPSPSVRLWLPQSSGILRKVSPDSSTKPDSGTAVVQNAKNSTREVDK